MPLVNRSRKASSQGTSKISNAHNSAFHYKNNLNNDQNSNKPYQATGNELRGEPPARTLYCISNWKQYDTEKKYIIKKNIHLEEVKITTEDYLNKVWPRQWYPTRCRIRDRGRLQHRHFLSPSQARQASIVISTT